MATCRTYNQTQLKHDVGEQGLHHLLAHTPGALSEAYDAMSSTSVATLVSCAITALCSRGQHACEKINKSLKISQKWSEKAKQYLEASVSTSQLQNLANEGRSLDLKFASQYEVIELVETRIRKIESWVENILCSCES